MSLNQNRESVCEVIINTEYGLHLRPADLFARTASQFASEIEVSHKDLTVNGKSILDLAMLAAECGTALMIRAKGPDADQAVVALSRLVESDFQAENAKTSAKLG